MPFLPLRHDLTTVPKGGITHDLCCRWNWVPLILLLVFLVHQLVPQWSPISCVLPSPGRSGPSRAEVGVAFRCVRLVQALFPPLHWSCSVSVGPPLFFSLALSGLARSGPGVLVCVFSLFFCVPLFAFWLSNLSFIFMFISPSFPLHLHLHLICTNTTLPKAECVCVCNI